MKKTYSTNLTIIKYIKAIDDILAIVDEVENPNRGPHEFIIPDKLLGLCSDIRKALEPHMNEKWIDEVEKLNSDASAINQKIAEKLGLISASKAQG
ncbi:MAG: hypothetical protein PHI47_06415 [Sulfuricurvum sp.]|uniref:hypothetical protein n=1 Tax=Sulfuricurvum sp. TaxID=2025608 RepID=UPI0026208C6A|nr:hypothetical protein [Sulfuricurvum sp.]MDD5159667.1 hypothetical protein [Sulfuricurvum sp.]